MKNSRAIYCSCCGKQAVSRQNPSRFDKFTTKMEGAKASFGGEVFCGYCAEELDENGLFPEEREEAWEMHRAMLYD